MKEAPFDKRAILDLLQARLEHQLDQLSASQTAAQTGATHPEARQEDPKDTRAIEATYLARGLADRVEGVRQELMRCKLLQIQAYGPGDAIGLTALIGVLGENQRLSIYFLVPWAAGEVLTLNDVEIRTLTPTSPLGRALVGRQVDDEIEVDLPGGRRIATIEWVH